jgi:hypothetical protein
VIAARMLNGQQRVLSGEGGIGSGARDVKPRQRRDIEEWCRLSTPLLMMRIVPGRSTTKRRLWSPGGGVTYSG